VAVAAAGEGAVEGQWVGSFALLSVSNSWCRTVSFKFESDEGMLDFYDCETCAAGEGCESSYRTSVAQLP
jgi:hypothetical protein